MFDEKLHTLIDSLPTMNREDGVQACKKFMYDEKNRRVIQERREGAKKVQLYSTNIVQSTPPPKQNATEVQVTSQPHVKGLTEESTVSTIEETIVMKQQSSGYQKKQVHEIKQWKVKQIYEAIQQNQENQYKDHCEQNNDLSKLQEWATFVLAVKGRPLAQVEPTIRAFVEELRTMRHNQLCYKKNASIVDREDREQWPATTVVRAFLDGKLDAFKKHTETQTGDKPEDATWQTRWNKFTASLEENRANESAMKELCSKFLTAQRTKRYRRQTRI